MDKNSHNTPCRVAPLATEAQRLIDASAAVDASSAAGDIHARDLMDLIGEALDGTLARASWLQAESARGALFQLGVLADVLSLHDAADPDKKAANRILQSLAAFIEKSEGVNREDCCGSYYLRAACLSMNDWPRLSSFLSESKKRLKEVSRGRGGQNAPLLNTRRPSRRGVRSNRISAATNDYYCQSQTGVVVLGRGSTAFGMKVARRAS